MPTVRCIAACLAAVFAVLPLSAADDLLVYIGTYTTGTSKGIYVSRLNRASGALSQPELVAETRNPSFLAAHPRGGFLYAVNEVDASDGKPTGSVSAYRIDRRSGKLSPVNQQSSGGAGPAHVSVDRRGRNVLVANYGGGSISVLPIGPGGRLMPASAFVQHTGSSVNPQRQREPHAHAIGVDPSDRFVYVADLGLDKILIHRFDPATGSLRRADPSFAAVTPGSGPRHFAISPDGRFLHVINELTCTITTFARDKQTGGLTEQRTVSTLPAGMTVEKGFSTAEIMVHPSGKFLYGSNRGHNTIAVFAVDASGGLTLVEHEPTQGNTPRGFNIDPSGAYLIAGNQRSDSVVVFRIDAKTGHLTSTGHKIDVGSPVSIEFVR